MLLVVGGLIYFGINRFSHKGGTSDTGNLSADEIAKMKGGPEAPDSKSVTTAKEYTFVPSAKLPEVKGTSAYQPLVDNTVRMALNVWAGWAPVIMANGGFKPGKVWKAPGGKTFKLELVLIDDPVAMRDAYASGKVHIGWATLDMVPLFVEQLRKDSRTMPRIYQQVDWSNGGDGIVCRANVKSVTDMRGKTVVLAQNSPSHYFLLNTLIAGGVQPSEVQYKFTQDAFQAAAAFNADKSIACAVSWSPDIYNLSDAKGNRMLVNTQTANKLIADVWFARADFAKDNAPIIEGLVRGIFEAMEALKSQDAKAQVAKLMAAGYSIPEKDALAMQGDAHSTNYAENREFFLNQNNPTNFERTWNTAYFLYKKIGSVSGDPVPFDQVMDFSVLNTLQSEAFFANQKNEYAVNFVPTSASAIQAESNEILTKTIVIQFYPNSDDIEKTIEKTVNGKTVQEKYDPQAPFVIEEAGKLSGQFGAARIVIEGHTDASMRGSGGVTAADVQELSLRRANAVKQALIRKFPSLQPNQFTTVGRGWDKPADPSDPGNNAKNRRVEIKVYPVESK
ncbi:MAG TPA: phosphate ABC transporter substrate-binding/OmpA family protein [Gemmatimonadaceae bacterium]|nr:phosphate ABC transporter substrate-binding/OmpA family protein [Gemmatimonadaceae bacterium]